jgi:hypothetical protein
MAGVGWVGLEPTTNALKGRGLTWQCSFIALLLRFCGRGLSFVRRVAPVGPEPVTVRILPPMTTMRAAKPHFRSDWNNLCRIDVVVRDVVVAFNVIEIHRVCDTRLLVKIA